MRILVSGASIAGPVLAYWLTRHGFDVTVVERAQTLRKTGGHAVDLFVPPWRSRKRWASCRASRRSPPELTT